MLHIINIELRTFINFGPFLLNKVHIIDYGKKNIKFVYVYKAVCCLLLCIILCPPLSGQSVNSLLSFDNLSWDFGSIRESDGSVFHTFNFVNTSSKTVQFGRVSPGCSCVSALMTQDSFESIETGEIIVKFNPAGATGKVTRYVDIYSTGGSLLVSLNVTADVIPERQNNTRQFPFKITDHVSADRDQINIGYIPLGGYVSESVSLVNTSSKKVELLVKPRDKSSFLTVHYPTVIDPGKTALIEITFSIPDTPHSYGVKKRMIDFWIDGVPCSFELSTSFICIDNIDKSARVSPDMILSPSLVALKKNMISRHFSGSLTLENKGSADLHIRAVETAPETSVNIQKGDVLHPGESRKVRAESSLDEFSIFFITDDPARPMKEIRFKYDIN